MVRTNFFFKVELEHGEDEEPEQLGSQICRQIEKLYGVRLAELSSFTKSEG